jgi:hypothetical protein
LFLRLFMFLHNIWQKWFELEWIDRPTFVQQTI